MPRVEVLSVAVGALFLFALLGFFGVSADNTQYLLGASERIDSEFLRNDWFVQATQSFHPFFEVYMAWWLALDQLVVGLFIWYVVNLLVLTVAVVALLDYLGVKERMPLAVLVTVGMMLAGVRHGWGMYEIVTGQALPAYLAYPPALLSIVLLFNRRYLLSALALVVTFLVHHGLGALMVLCLLGPLIVTMPRTRREIVQACSGAALVLAVYLPVVLSTVDQDGSEASQFAILFYGRSPQHFAVQFSDFRTHMSSLHIFASSIILAFTIASSDIRLRILSLIGGIAALCALGYLLLEVWYTPVFVRLFPYRAIPMLVVLNSCMIVSLLLAKSSTRRDLVTAGLVALSSVSFSYSMLVSMLLLGSAVAARWVIPVRHVAKARESRATVLVTCSAGVLALLHSAILYPPAFFPDWPRPAQRVLAGALAEHTPESAIIVVPPWLSGIRISAGRAIVVNMKNFPVFGPEMVMWADRIHDVSGIDPRDARQYLQKGANIWQLYNQGYHSRSLPELVGAARKYNARFILVSTKSRFHWEAGQVDLPVLWSGTGFALYETPDGIVHRGERQRRMT